jgi:trimeric autotransporter adhesin
VPLTAGIAKWDGANWLSVGGAGQFGIVTDFSIYNNELYAIGYFDSIGGIQAYSIAKYDGNTWSAIADTIFRGESLACSEVYQENLYIGSTMHISSLGIDCIASYDGSNWSSVPNATFQNGMCGISTMQVFHNKLFVGGYFSLTVGAPGNGVAEWNGSAWSNVGGGLMDSLNYPAVISDMCVHQDKLIVAGAFSFAGGIPARQVAMWNDTLWCGFGSVFNSSAGAVESFNDSLYIAGGFTRLDGDTFDHIAKWIGGNFVDTCGNTTGIFESETKNEVLIYPNPANTVLQMSFNIPERYQIIITDQFGRYVKHLEFSGTEAHLNIEDIESGLYFYHATSSAGNEYIGKIMIAH